MPRVLIPVDGSDHSLRAVNHAVGLKDSLREKLEVLLLNVQHPVPMSALLLDGRLSTVRRLEEPLREHGLAQLARASAALTAAGIEFQPHVEIGEPAPVIAGFAATYHCEMIIMGTRGLGAIAGIWLGSVATRVVHLAKAPVVLVP
jgi:nucleotide-binding universal stress UspA family protein